MGTIESIAIIACITVFSLGLLVVSLLSYKKHKNTKLLFVSVVFFIFFIKGIVLSLGIFLDYFSNLTYSIYLGLLDLVVLIMLFIATLKR